LRHDPEFRAARREHLHEVGKRVRLKEDLNILARILREHLPARFHFCVISASPREVIQSALEGIVPAENVFGTEFAYDDRTGEISGMVRVPAGYGKVAVLEQLQLKLHCIPDRTIYVGDGSSDLYVMHHVNSYDGLTVAVSETKSIARIARRTVLSDNALSVLVPILEETLGWTALQIRDLFTSCGVAIHEWDKIRAGWVTFHRVPTPFVVNETGRQRFEADTRRVIRSETRAARIQIRPPSLENGHRERVVLHAAPKYCARNFMRLLNEDLRTLEKNTMKTNPSAQGSGWNVSFWFALSSPLLGVLLGILAAAIFCR